MTREDIIRMAREAGMIGTGDAGNELERLYREAILDALPRFAALVAAAERKEWQGLTDEEVRAFEVWLDDEEEKHGWNPPQDIIEYIEAKLKEKNT